MKSRDIQIYSPNAEEMAEFTKLSQAAGLEFLEKNAGKEWVQKLIQAMTKPRKRSR